MADKYDYERRLHSLVWDIATLETYYAEYSTFVNLTPREEDKFLREIGHKYFELTGEPYEEGVFNVEGGENLLSWESQNLTFGSPAIDENPESPDELLINNESNITAPAQ